jgi:hypothetical protein
MMEGDRVGLAIILFNAAQVGVSNVDSKTMLEMMANVLMGPRGEWMTVYKSEAVESVEIAGETVRLRVDSQVNSKTTLHDFSYSTDGSSTFNTLGQRHRTLDSQLFLVGDRWGLFNIAAKICGKHVAVRSLTTQ